MPDKNTNCTVVITTFFAGDKLEVVLKIFQEYLRY